MTNLSTLFPAFSDYTPAMMQFDGSTGYYSKTGISPSGNKVTAVVRFSVGPITGDITNMVLVYFPATGYYRIQLDVVSDNHSSATTLRGKMRFIVKNAVGTVVCQLITPYTVTDNTNRTVFASFDGDAGTAVFYVDGVDADDNTHGSRVAPTTATLSSASSSLYFGASVGSSYLNGLIGFCGIKDVGGLNWSDFMETDGTPKELDTVEWTQWNSGTAQAPMMTFDGSTGYYNKSFTSAGNKVTSVSRFKGPSFVLATDTVRYVSGCLLTNHRLSLQVMPSDHADSVQQSKLKMIVRNSSGTTICELISATTVADDVAHTVFASFDGDNGLATFYIDGVNADNTGWGSRVAPTTGTLYTGAITIYTVGAGSAGSFLLDGEIGFSGHAEAYLTNWSDFMELDGTPKEIDEISWKQWGGQPLFWNKGGLMTDNKGSAGDMTANGTITGPSGGWPLFWNEHGDMENNLGSAGNMTENGLIVVGKSGN